MQLYCQNLLSRHCNGKDANIYDFQFKPQDIYSWNTNQWGVVFGTLEEHIKNVDFIPIF